MKHFDLFSGYGGFTLALQRAYEPLHNKSKNEGLSLKADMWRFNSDNAQRTSTIGFSEIDKYASAVLKYRWPKVKNYGDITKIVWEDVPDFDLLTGGSPCQDLSIAGKRAGLSGKRSGLFYEFMRALKIKKPKFFIWENVKGALSSQGGWDFASVLSEMAEAGYSLWWQVLNAKDFGVPQNRERIFVVGFRDESAPEVFFESRGSGQNLREITKNVSDAQRIYDSSGLAKSQKALGGGMGAKTGLYTVSVPEATKKGYSVAGGGDSINLSQINSKTRRGRVGYGIAQTIDTGMQQYTLNGEKIRRLTPLECERLMGLPDHWTEWGLTNYWSDEEKETIGDLDSVSDSQRYKMCGNGVVVNVVEKIIRTLILKQGANPD